jgi:predicted ATPase
MLTRLRFKNWRSLHDVEIKDLTPITVFIGANSSGKTNIIDALRFHRDSYLKGILRVVSETGYTRILTNALENSADVELEFTYKLDDLSSYPIIDRQLLRFDKRDVPFRLSRRLYEGDALLLDEPWRELPSRDVVESSAYFRTKEQKQLEQREREVSNYILRFVLKRWQILSEHFSPPLTLAGSEGGDLYTIESDANNTLLILDFMRRVYPDLYEHLQEDLTWMLQHVTGLEMWQDVGTRDLEMVIRETEKVAPTISAGTARLIAMLTVIYALDMPQEISFFGNQEPLKPSMPGLIVIEEPDTALNPWLLSKFVEQLRNYVDRADRPRQFILTTHNPAFLDLFERKEVRVVERDAQGYTTVKEIPEYVEEIWLDKYGLGEVWTTNSFGGLAE